VKESKWTRKTQSEGIVSEQEKAKQRKVKNLVEFNEKEKVKFNESPWMKWKMEWTEFNGQKSINDTKSNWMKVNERSEVNES
jgi:DUF4097 and DUF4098 domain-containing protein YvlB